MLRIVAEQQESIFGVMEELLMDYILKVEHLLLDQKDMLVDQ